MYSLITGIGSSVSTRESFQPWCKLLEISRIRYPMIQCQPAAHCTAKVHRCRPAFKVNISRSAINTKNGINFRYSLNKHQFLCFRHISYGPQCHQEQILHKLVDILDWTLALPLHDASQKGKFHTRLAFPNQRLY